VKQVLGCVCVLLLGAWVAAAQPVVNEGGVLNAASYALPGLPNYGVAQGSIFVVFGRNLGPASLVRAGFPLPTSQGLSETSIKVTVGATTVDAIMIYTSAGQVAAILPSNTPVGDGRLTLTYQGQTSTPVSIRVVRTAFGIFTINSAGSGPGVVTDANYQYNLLTSAAQPGQVMILWGTGLGPVTFSETTGAPVQDLPVDTQVYVGGRLARVLFRGRSPGSAGLDQINFEVPAGVEGCYVPIVVRAGGVNSNWASMSVATARRVCSDATGYSGDELERVARGEALRIGSILLSRSLTKFTVPILGSVEIRSDQGDGHFQRYDPARLLAAQGFSGSGSGFGVVAQGACTVYAFQMRETPIPVDPVRPDMLDAGPLLNLSGPKGAKQLRQVSKGIYTGELGGGAPSIPGFPGGAPEYLDKGSYTLNNGGGGADVGAFQATLTIADPLEWTNQDAISDVPRAQDVTLTWRGGDSTKQYALIYGASTNQTAKVTGVFLCAERIGAGRFTVPSIVLSSLPASEVQQGVPTGMLILGSGFLRDAGKFTAPGLDIGYFTYSEQIMKNVNYR